MRGEDGRAGRAVLQQARGLANVRKLVFEPVVWSPTAVHALASVCSELAYRNAGGTWTDNSPAGSAGVRACVVVH